MKEELAEALGCEAYPAQREAARLPPFSFGGHLQRSKELRSIVPVAASSLSLPETPSVV